MLLNRDRREYILFEEFKKYIITGIVIVVVLCLGAAGYFFMRPPKELPHVYEDIVEQTKIFSPDDLKELQEEEEKTHTDEAAVTLEEGALEEKTENDTPEIDAESLDIQKNAEAELKKVYEDQQKKLDSGELKVGDTTDIENGVIAKEDIVEYSSHDDVLPIVNYSTEKAIADVTTILGPGGKEHWTIEGNYEEEDWQQLLTDPYSSPALQMFFDEYKKYGDLETFSLSVRSWLRNGGDDGVPHGEVYG